MVGKVKYNNKNQTLSSDMNTYRKLIEKRQEILNRPEKRLQFFLYLTIIQVLLLALIVLQIWFL